MPYYKSCSITNKHVNKINNEVTNNTLIKQKKDALELLRFFEINKVISNTVRKLFIVLARIPSRIHFHRN